VSVWNSSINEGESSIIIRRSFSSIRTRVSISNFRE
jgi:hypothetical protein